MKKRRHLTPKQICAQCNAIAREKRMAERTPWTAMGIMCAYVLMKKEGFKRQRLLKITNRINELEKQYDSGEFDLKQISERLFEKADWTIVHETYTEADIKARKGSYQYWLDKVQIEPQNAINEQAIRYMLFFFTALMDEYGYGKERLTRVQDYMNELLELYKYDKTTVREWRVALLDEVGIAFEMPLDPLTQTKGSIMTG